MKEMKNQLFAPFVLFFLIACNSNPKSPPVESENTVFQPEDKEILEEVFDLFSEEKDATTSALMVKVGGFFQETPYVAHTLETEKEQLVINLRERKLTSLSVYLLSLVMKRH